jgi:DtxR family Mn-dependent transcriptional regulator
LLIIRRHRLWEYFLAEKLKFRWDEVHSVAEDLEHVGSRMLIEKLDEFLGYPRFDPHGDPIPDSNGRIEAARQTCIIELPLNKQAVVCHVSDQSNEMLEVLRHKKIGLGTKVEVKKRFDFDNSMEIRTGRLATITISSQLAKNIYVRG